jgi:hypothetical protein
MNPVSLPPKGPRRDPVGGRLEDLLDVVALQQRDQVVQPVGEGESMVNVASASSRPA